MIWRTCAECGAGLPLAGDCPFCEGGRTHDPSCDLGEDCTCDDQRDRDLSDD